MPFISEEGGGGGGPAAGTYIPVADAAGVTVDSTTYDDLIKGGGAKLTTLVFPSDAGALAIALAGDAFPRWILGADAANDGFLLGDGTVNAFAMGGLVVNNVGTPALFGQGVHGIGVSPAAAATEAVRLSQLSPRFTKTSGALSTVALASGTGTQIQLDTDSETLTPVTFNPGAATTATCTVALSPDDITYSTLGVETEPAGVAFDGTVHLIKVRVPGSWYLKLTVNAQATLGTTTYY